MSAPTTERTPPRWPSRRAWADVAVLLVLTLLGVIGFEPSFGGYGFLLAGLGGLLVGAATGILTSVFRLGAIITALVAIVGFFLFGTLFAVPHLGLLGFVPTLQSLASLAIGSVYGWADIVTLSTPIGAPQYIAVVPYVATWIVALLSTTLACRWLPTPPRAAWRFAIALIAPIALYLAGILVGTDEPYQAGIRGVVFGVLALVWLGWRRPTGQIASAGGGRLRSRKLAGTAVIVVGAVVVGGAAAFVTAPPKDERFVLREEIEPPFDPLDYPSPLAGFRHYTKQVTDDVLFTVEGLAVGDVVRLATLDAYTGKLWNVTDPATDAAGSGSFALVGRDLPEPSLITPERRDGVTFTIQDYADVWVPGVGYPIDLQFTGGDAAGAGDDLRYNSATGTAVLTSGLKEGDRYTIDAEVQEVIAPSELADAQPAAVNLSPVNGVPDIVTVRAQEFAGDGGTPIAQLEAMRLALVDSGFLSHGRASDSVPSRAGHGADRITELFERNQMIGDQEQYASAFALMARSLGYPARVVMGFAPEVPEGGAAVEVTGDDVTAWVEVAFDGVGWVAFNPTPDETDIPQDQVPKPQSEPQPQVRQPPRADNDEEDLLSPVELEETEEDENGLPFNIPGWVFVLGLSVLIPAALFFIPLLIIGAIKSRRLRKRRTTGPQHDRVAGAWQELTDQYSELGFEVPPKLTRVMVASRLEEQLGVDAPRLRPLAAATDEAVFSGDDVDDARSDTVWTESMAAVEVARGAVTASRRLLSRFRIRSARDWVARAARSTKPEGRR
ncbi:transglutaminase-like domain-containing protein [Leifsonia sp. H3M29-4]|uniref:transglutaminase-like domain-containing protein n=1 Tax=Salinibacterium metalliresistens TaxID=3031321 RepID=UPI0023DC5440|nr:transglutaminase-like domain-containing protein [Salinibacterium metalliresistens]MDF1479350.1 transglutaminase-like domain-containing protein [Salinibacterium metalliresistens]